MAAWDAYTALHDENELAENLTILCNVRQNNDDMQDKGNNGFGI
jgi:hypothetical protein